MNPFPDLFRHLVWADAALLSAVHAHPASLNDETMLTAVRHIVRVERVFYARFTGGDAEAVRELPADFGGVVAVCRRAHEELLQFVDGLGAEDWERTFAMPALGIEPTIAEGLTQIMLHSQNHRGQCLTRLRENGGTPPRLDYILWIQERPAPSYPTVD